MPSEVQYTETICDAVTTKYLERHNEWVLHEIAVDCAVEDVNGAVVGGRREERVGRVVCNGTKGFGMISKL
jgi:hypothetical protein